MAKQVLNNGETHGVIRGKANDNFTELYNITDSHLAENAAKFTAVDVTLAEHANDITGNNNSIAIERGRINLLVAPPAGVDNAETADIRIDIDGNTHASAGDAVRSQITIVNDILDVGFSYLPAVAEPGNNIMTTTGTWSEGIGFHAELTVIPGQKYLITGWDFNATFPLFISLFNNVVVEYYPGPHEVGVVDYAYTVPNGVNRIIINDQVAGHASAKVLTKNKLSVEMNKHWKGKKIAWFSTSIGAGIPTNNYPQMVAELTGANVYNEGVAASCARAGVAALITGADPYGWSGSVYNEAGRSLAGTLVEKQYLIDNWNTFYPETTLTQEMKDVFLECSYENRLDKYLSGGSVGQCDLYIFDHGHNDQHWNADFLTIPEERSATERFYFIGALNFLIRRILEDNPRARIIFTGHYENDLNPKISQGQELIAEYWSFPIIKIWEKLGWSQKTVNTTGYWSNGIWVPSGGTSQSLTMKQVYIPDDLHPHTDLSGYANQMIADVIAGEIDRMR